MVPLNFASTVRFVILSKANNYKMPNLKLNIFLYQFLYNLCNYDCRLTLYNKCAYKACKIKKKKKKAISFFFYLARVYFYSENQFSVYQLSVKPTEGWKIAKKSLSNVS